MKPIIGVVSKPNIYVNDKEFTQQVIYDGIRCAILDNGGLVVGILPTQNTNIFSHSDEKTDEVFLKDEEKKDLHRLIDMCDGIVLQGGLSSASYEIEVAKYAISQDIPLLGICAGFNNIVRAMGGEVSKLTDAKFHNNDLEYAHKNKILKNTMLFDILAQEEIEVNSIHDMVATTDDVKNLEISSYSEDGYVEAVELKKNKFMVAVKWHPELMLKYDKLSNKLFERFILECRR